MRRSKLGATMLEVCVVLAVLGVMLSVVAISLRSQSVPHEQRLFGAVVRSARMRALRSGEAVSIAVRHDERIVHVAVRPTGLISTDGTPPADSASVSVLWEAYAHRAR